MTHNELFGNAKWIMPKEDLTSAIFKNTFSVYKSSNTEITISGLGYFEFYINGVRVGDDYLVPAYSDYIPRDRKKMNLGYPISDTMDNRLYALKYDISSYVNEGENVIGVMVGGGYFHQDKRLSEGNMDYGNVRICYKIVNGDNEAFSDTNVMYQQGFIKMSNLFFGEEHDYNGFDYNWSNKCCSENNWKNTVECDNMYDTPIFIQDCNTDRIKRTFNPIKIKDLGDCSLYDVGENITGYPIVTCDKSQEKITVYLAENINDDYTLNFDSIWNRQKACDTFVTDGITNVFYPRFLWHGFRYFTVTNNAKVEKVVELHSDVNVTSGFECSDETINWLYNTYIHTQLCNTHSGVMTDCPHRERLGYTGDGQLCAVAGMLTLDMQKVYKKWIYDIIDSQDKTTGHVQHTAPFAGGGGGPAGWGGAILTVPYNYYKQYGDLEFLKECYPYMKKFVAYMESRCENGLIVREEKGGWCLGDWCTLEEIALPEDYVNTCMYITQLNMLNEVEKILGVDNSETLLLIENHKLAVDKAYPMNENGSRLDCLQGADAFSVDCGVHNKSTLKNIYDKYDSNTTYDTGIFGTYLLNNVLFENGYADLALRLLSNKGPGSFYNMKKNGATTLWERWSGNDSHNHPMFGASVEYLFTKVLGITQEKDSYGYEKILINPKENSYLSFAKGHIETVKGKISVEFNKNQFVVNLPEDTTARFVYGDIKKTLLSGENIITIGD